MEKTPDLSQMKRKMIQVDRGGPESRCGRLLAVKSDHLVLHCEDEGIIYYQTHHIKSLSLNTKDYSDEEEFEVPKFLDVENFNSVLQNMKERWVKINRGGPENIEGVLTDVWDDSFFVVVNNEVIRIFTFHVRNISYVMEKNNNEEEKDKQNKEDHKDENKVENNEEQQDKE